MITFNTATDDYMVFIQRIRDWAKDPKRVSHGRPVLPYPPPTLKQAQYMDLELRGDKRITVKVRRHDLYIVGFRMEGPNHWFEFMPERGELPVIPNSVSLGFRGNYDSLGTLESLGPVEHNTFKTTIDALGNKKTNHDTRKSSLRALLVMISESVRFQKLSDLFASVMKNPAGKVEFQSWMKTLINNWGELSNRLLCEDQFGIYFKLPDDSNTGKPHILTRELQIVTSADAAKCIALLKGNPPNLDELQHNEPGTTLRWKGYYLLQVYSVRINNFAGEIYGEIKVTDDMGTYNLYDRERTHCESIQDSHTLTLTGPNRGSTARAFTVSLDLKKRGNKSSSDAEISKGRFEWKVDEVNKIFDQHLSKVVTGESGSATVYYTPFRDAVQASVEAVLVYGDGKDTVEVYGSLKARYINYDFPNGNEQTKSLYRSTLFDKVPKDKVKVKRGNSIPLSRSVIAVPTMDTLMTELNLISATSGHVIATGTADFSPQLNGKTVKDIKGKYGHVRVTVTWKVVSLHPKK